MKRTRKITPRNAALSLVALSAVGLWGAGRLTWVSAHARDELAGDSTHKLVGAVWDPATTPLALALLATVVLSLAVGPLVRRILGTVIVALSAIASFRAVMLLTTGADSERARQLLTSGAATQMQSKPVQIADWAGVTSVDVHYLPVVLALLAAAAGVVGGVLLAMWPGRPTTGSTRFDTPETRRRTAEEDLAENPDEHRVLWDALDAGVDPTQEGEGESTEGKATENRG
ncbi:TIGR02234 family membrane protein [Corynebacterium heidelbergense]|uniref:TIGR02234 family membrane protein n=1 Tax=Corynebacterium heidelbergense TaxID=2055947 RepID=A0A364VAB4_9CORY|nr:TIGR02234 family membrane protein [Corynebacterium heidelbergense]RAV33554.1 TIGR02234 family membrane protein [Corynebacterium heidelbergense]WCZ36416.1 Tryptophan-associated transmembrane protein [Corynebacterium heidelbergense]